MEHRTINRFTITDARNSKSLTFEAICFCDQTTKEPAIMLEEARRTKHGLMDQETITFLFHRPNRAQIPESLRRCHLWTNSEDNVLVWDQDKQRWIRTSASSLCDGYWGFEDCHDFSGEPVEYKCSGSDLVIRHVIE